MPALHRIPADPIDALRLRTSVKWRAYPDDVLPLFIAEMDYPLAGPIAEVLHDAARRSDTGYAGMLPAFAESFAGFSAARFGWRVDPARVSLASDVGTGIVEVLRASIEPGSGVILTPPVYPPFFGYVGEAGHRLVEVPMHGGIDDGWALDLDGIDAAFAAGARAIVLCNPHNPLGYVPDAASLASLAEIAHRHGAVVVADEVHGALAYASSAASGSSGASGSPGASADAAFTPFLTVSDAAREVGVVVTGATKAFNLAGLKAAAIVTDSERADRVRSRMPEAVGWRASQFGVLASIAAFAEGTWWLDGVLGSLDDNRRLLADLVADQLPGVRYRVPDATYLAWLDLGALGWGDDPAAHALEHARVALSAGPEFGAPTGRGHARLNFACAPEVLAEAVQRLADARVAPADA
ncbi:MalY/PatB family protein [Agromyces sp. NPDC058110]|uniref:MalY/PatB family protein n=1 Tax=Agromyces sp. NPDC058110 TaxID=3346345 RepID=UPI0036DA2DA7